MIKQLSAILCFSFSICSLSSQQINIQRIDNMPDLPSPYAMRDWKQVAVNYDRLVFDTSKTGNFFPLVSLKGKGINYPEITPIYMDTYVGTNTHGKQAEAINILPAIVGASLAGIDKTTSSGHNWVGKAIDFFNKKNGQNVYLNNYSASTGNDWWYEIMPNVYFYQLYYLYPETNPEFGKQFTIVAGRWLQATYQLGGKTNPWTAPDMNYRAFNLITGKPLTGGVKEPESAGSIAWILYHAYLQTKETKYLEGAQLSLDFLQKQTSNPSYELQLPYGALIAAKMNALEGTNYDLTKLVNWCFQRGDLRGWGAITGRWGNYDVSGLIGEANDQSDDYAFVMNGFQQAAALVPLVKYDKRFAHAIAKWMLNVSNASRLFYWNALPVENQEAQSYAWASVNDPDACIPYESMKQRWNGKQPFAMGDAVKGGWAATNLSLYSGSSVGYLAALIDKTNVEGILQLDLNATDFFGENKYPAYLYYNPASETKSVKLLLPATGNFDVYDAITETILFKNATQSCTFTIDSGQVRMTVIYPSGKEIQQDGRLKKIDGQVIDYHAGYNYNPIFRMKTLTTSATEVTPDTLVQLYCLVENVPSGYGVFYRWSVDGTEIPSASANTFTWNAPASTGFHTLSVTATSGGKQISDSLRIRVENEVVLPPVISTIAYSSAEPFAPSVTVRLSADISQSDHITAYQWSVDQGVLDHPESASPLWHLPASSGVYRVNLQVTNRAGFITGTKYALVKAESAATPVPLIYYPFNGNVFNQASDAYHGIYSGATLTNDAREISQNAYRFSNSSDIIYTPWNTALDFTDKISLCFWMKVDNWTGNEQFLISHGSWEERYKVSITPEKKLRWTLKTEEAIVDADAPMPLEAGKYYYFTVLYTGYSLEIYANGSLVSYVPHSGNIAHSSKNITYGRKDNNTTEYAFKGCLDEIRIYNADLPLSFIRKLPDTWTLNTSSALIDIKNDKIKIYPNPVRGGTVTVENNTGEQTLEIYDLTGCLLTRVSTHSATTTIDISGFPEGVYLLKMGANTAKIIKAR